MGTINSELRKIFTLKWWWILCLILALIAAALVWINSYFYSSALTDPLLQEPDGAGGGIPGLDNARTVTESIYRAPLMLGYLLAFTGGALLVGGETTHKTWTSTFAATPRRWAVIGGKTIAAVVVGLLTGLTHVVVAVAVGAPLTSLYDGLEAFPEPAQLTITLATFVLAHVLWALLGMGLNLLTNSTIITIIIGFVFTLIGDQVVSILAMQWDWVADVVRFLPGPATGALTRSDASIWEELPAWAGGLLLASYAGVLLLLGGLRRTLKDVD